MVTATGRMQRADRQRLAYGALLCRGKQGAGGRRGHQVMV